MIISRIEKGKRENYIYGIYHDISGSFEVVNKFKATHMILKQDILNYRLELLENPFIIGKIKIRFNEDKGQITANKNGTKFFKYTFKNGVSKSIMQYICLKESAKSEARFVFLKLENGKYVECEKYQATHVISKQKLLDEIYFLESEKQKTVFDVSNFVNLSDIEIYMKYNLVGGKKKLCKKGRDIIKIQFSKNLGIKIYS